MIPLLFRDVLAPEMSGELIFKNMNYFCKACGVEKRNGSGAPHTEAVASVVLGEAAYILLNEEAFEKVKQNNTALRSSRYRMSIVPGTIFKKGVWCRGD